MRVVAEFDLGKERYIGEVTEINWYSIWAKVPKRIKNKNGDYEILLNEFSLIKRHVIKHGVKYRRG